MGIGRFLRKNDLLAGEIVFLILLVALLLVPDWPAGYVIVSTVPDGHIETAEGMVLPTPARIPVPAAGVRVTARAEGWLPADTLVLPHDSRITLSLGYPFPARIETRPPGVAVRIDGRPRGITPLEVRLGRPGLHRVELLAESGIHISDSICSLANIPDTLTYAIPRPVGEDLMIIPAGDYPIAEGIVSSDSFIIGRYEVTTSRFCDFLNAVDPLAETDTTCRSGYTLLMESLFPCDWPPGLGGDSTGYSPDPGMENHPVVGVSRRGAGMYCRWLASRSTAGLEYSLPDPVSWEIAASSGTIRRYPWGNASPSGEMLNLSDGCDSIAARCPGLDDGYSRTSPVGEYPSNPWGLWDMAGNVWEWCEAESAVAMGGSWLSDSSDCRCSSRIILDEDRGYPFVGFRVYSPAPGGGE